MTRTWGVALALLTFGCAPSFVATSSVVPILEPLPATIDRIELAYSNVYLLRHAGTAVLVDAGSGKDVEATTNALGKLGLRPSDVKAVVLTHAHGDHAGMAPFFQKQGVKIVVGRGDEAMTAVGHNDEMIPQSAFAWLIKPIVRLDYDPFTPDVLVDDQLDLASYGMPGVKVRHMPGHTRGSLVIQVGDGEAIVGDMMLGGTLGGAFHASTAGEHYYQLEPARNRCNIRALIDSGIETFHLGHGGPVNRDAVLEHEKAFADLVCQ